MAGFFAFRGKNGRKTLVLIWSFFVQQRKFALTKRRDLNHETHGAWEKIRKRRRIGADKRRRIGVVKFCNLTDTVVYFYLYNYR